MNECRDDRSEAFTLRCVLLEIVAKRYWRHFRHLRLSLELQERPSYYSRPQSLRTFPGKILRKSSRNKGYHAGSLNHLNSGSRHACFE